MVAQQKMKEEEVEKTENGGVAEGGKQPGSPKSRLAMLKRSSAKKAAQAESDPFRFQGVGVSYKGKLIGVRDVDSARGDAMCADAMRDAKAAVKAAGTHKQRIVLAINIEGIKINDEKTQTTLYTFPVSRVSFIARDTTDARAFGFVFGQPDGKYKFYGIKTAQTADHAVLAIRDMFQVVYDMKRKQIEQMKQEKEEKDKKQEMEDNGIRSENGVLVADLLDLETELHNIAQGVNQLAHIPVVAGDEWPGEQRVDAFGQQPFGAPAKTAAMQDPFGDSFGTDSFLTNTSSSFAHSTPQQVGGGGVGLFQPVLSQSPATVFGAQPAPSMLGNTSSAAMPWGTTQLTHFSSAPNFSETNPFASVVQSGGPSMGPAAAANVDPFDTTGVRATLGAIPPMHFNQSPTVNWNLGNENSAPAMHHAHSFQANFSELSAHHISAPAGSASASSSLQHEWEGNGVRKVSTLEEAFNKLVDMDSLVTQPQAKKNPFDHLINPPKVPLNALSSGPAPMVAAPFVAPRQPAPPALVFPGKTNDPFADDFFN